MSSKPETPADEAAAGEEGAPKKGGKKKLIMMAAVPVVLIGIGAGLWFSGILPGLLGMKHEEPQQHAEEIEKPSAPVFVDMPDMIANLGGTTARPTYIKLGARLEVGKAEDAEKVKLALPRLQDMFQTYLREMRPEELRTSMGIYRLREELLGRANVAVAPVKVRDVLFIQMLIQ
jgi:flagellar FliL protein